MREAVQCVIDALGLQPHPVEGGWFVETYRHSHGLPATALPRGYNADRSVGTAIYYLLTADSFSEMHRLPTDEVFHFYVGGPVQMLQLFPDGSGRTPVLGTDLAAGQRPQIVVPAGVWQGSFVLPGGESALLGATVAPGFDYADYERGDREALGAQYPQFAAMIERLTRPKRTC